MVDPRNPFPHPDKRMWHPMAAPFAELLMMVMAIHPESKTNPWLRPNYWRDDVLHYLRRQHGERLDWLKEGLEEFLRMVEGS